MRLRLVKIMLTFEQCKKKLNKNGYRYSNNEIQLLLDVLNKLADIELRQLKNSIRK